MPELPEVESIASQLRDAHVEGTTICKVKVHWSRTVSKMDVGEFIKRLINQKIVAITRRGKYLRFKLSNHASLFVHFKMTGRFKIGIAPTELEPHERITLELDDGRTLQYLDTRKFGRWVLADKEEAVVGKLGPEPLDLSFTEEEFAARISKKKRQLKPLLLDQSFIAGLGNIYVDEALWRAQLHPKTIGNTLSKQQSKKLLQAIRFVLTRGLKSQGTTLGSAKTNFYLPDGSKGKHQTILDVFRKTGLPCPRCGTTIVRIIVAQRSTHLCPHCQKV